MSWSLALAATLNPIHTNNISSGFIPGIVISNRAVGLVVDLWLYTRRVKRRTNYRSRDSHVTVTRLRRDPCESEDEIAVGMDGLEL